MLLNFFRVITLFAAVSFCGLGIFIYSHSRNLSSREHRTLCSFLMVTGLWSFGFFLTMFESFSYEFALASSRVSHFFGGLTGITYLSFVVAFLATKRKAKVRPFDYAFAIFNAVMCFSPWMIKELPAKMFFPYYPEPGVLYPFYIMNFVSPFSIAYVLLFKAYRDQNFSLIERKQILMALWGVLIGWTGVSALFLLIYNIQIAPTLLILLPAIFVFFAYSIVRYRFLDIEVIIKRTLVFAGLVAASTIAIVVFPRLILQRYLNMPQLFADIVGIIAIVVTYGPLRNWLVNITDRYLFQKKYDYKELLKRFTDEVMVVLDLKRVAEMTVTTIADTVKLDGASLLLLNKDSRKYESVAVRGGAQKAVVDEQEPFITFLRETHEPIGQDGEMGKVRFPDEVRDRVKRLGARLCLPLNVHDDLIGVLCLGKKKSDEEFSKDDLDILVPLARTLAIAVSNAQLVEELKVTQAQAAQKEKLAVIGTLSAGINHEICNPLGIVKAQCEAFLLDAEDGILIGKNQQEVLERTENIMRVALKQIDRATAITQKLSNFAKPIKEATMQAVPVEQEIDEVLLLVGHDLKLEKIEVAKEMQPGLPPILVDRRQLQEVLFNLIRNAGQAIVPPGKIWVRARVDGDKVRIEIADTGSGIPADKIEKIWDPFFTTKDPGKGTGLGLFIVRQMVERNKGRITLESAVGKGTTFFLDFPVATELAPRGA